LFKISWKNENEVSHCFRATKFDISKKVAEYEELKGNLYACGSCLEIRGRKEAGVCPVSTMTDLLKMVEESDKVLVFG